jgi:hypothetical protein
MPFEYHSMVATEENMRIQREQAADCDKTPIQENRKPYLRSEQNEEIYSGLVIGDQRDSRSCLADKKSAQSIYKHLLAKDIEKNLGLTRQRSPVNRQRASYKANIEEEKFTRGLKIGKDIDVEKQERRDASKLLMKQTLVDLDDKLEAKILKQQQLDREQEKYSGFYIGADEELARNFKKEEQKKYYAQLTIDNHNQNGEDLYEEETEVVQLPEKPLHTGLQIGGFSLDNSKSMQYLYKSEKLKKQKDYSNALHKQQTHDAQIMKEKELIVNKNLSIDTVPYMRNGTKRF